MPPSLYEALAAIPDPRSRRGRRFPLVPCLCLVALGLLIGRQSLAAILQLHEDFGDGLPLALGFPRARFPSADALSALLARLDPDAVEAALAAWVLPRLPRPGAIAIDGKTLRGSRDGAVPGHHLISAYAPAAKAVLAQMRVDAKTNEHKAALRLLGLLPLSGQVVTGDAMFCQRDVATAIIDAGGDYVLTVKANQPGLETDIAAGFGFEEAARSIAAAFSPRAPGTAAGPGRGDGSEGARASGVPEAGDDEHPGPRAPVGGPAAGVPGHEGADGEGGDVGGSALRDNEPEG
jgi:DDE family transposase